MVLVDALFRLLGHEKASKLVSQEAVVRAKIEADRIAAARGLT